MRFSNFCVSATESISFTLRMSFTRLMTSCCFSGVTAGIGNVRACFILILTILYRSYLENARETHLPPPRSEIGQAWSDRS